MTHLHCMDCATSHDLFDESEKLQQALQYFFFKAFLVIQYKHIYE